MVKKRHVYLVRHAESQANTQGIYQGISYNTDLSELGRKQADLLAKRFQEIFLEILVTSPLKRTKQTVEGVEKIKNIKATINTDIIETNHGDWEGKSKAEIQKTWPKLYKKWQKFPSAVQFPGGEHFLDTQKRSILWWKNFSEKLKGDTLVVSHANIIQILISYILKKKLNQIWKFPMQPTAVSVIEIDNKSTKLIKLNDVSHLGNLRIDLAKHAL